MKEKEIPSMQKKIIDDMNKIDIGLGAENFIKSLIQRTYTIDNQIVAFDTFKPDTDYGIDLIILKRNSLLEKKQIYHYLQIKSCAVDINSDDLRKNNKSYCDFEINVAYTTLKLLQSINSFGLAIVLYEKSKDYLTLYNKTYPFFHFWITNQDFNKARKFDEIASNDQGHSQIGPYYKLYFRIKKRNENNLIGKYDIILYKDHTRNNPIKELSNETMDKENYWYHYNITNFIKK